MSTEPAHYIDNRHPYHISHFYQWGFLALRKSIPHTESGKTALSKGIPQRRDAGD